MREFLVTGYSFNLQENVSRRYYEDEIFLNEGEAARLNGACICVANRYSDNPRFEVGKYQITEIQKEDKVMEHRERTKLYVKICERAEKMGYNGKRITLMMDIENADMRFHLRLNELLNANDMDFAHDVFGIANHIDRTSYPATDFGSFVPRFAKV